MLLALLLAVLWPPPPALSAPPGWCVPAALISWLGTPYPSAARVPEMYQIWQEALAIEGNPVAPLGVYLDDGWAVLETRGYIVPGTVRTTRDRETGAAWFVDGPVVLETPWYSGMSLPATDGTVAIWGAYQNRHVVSCYGLTDDGSWMCLNVWGADWGNQGRFHLQAYDLDWLLSHGAAIETAQKVSDE